MSGYYLLVTAWALVSPFQYGYHTSSLNQIQHTLTCQTPSDSPLAGPSTCVSMSDAIFGVVTSSFTLGGFVGSITASLLLERVGRRGVLLINSVFIAVGSAVFAASSTVAGLIIGRLVIGLGCGLGLCALPLYLAETSPAHLKDKVGVLNQLSITVGILLTQCIGLPLARKSEWRLVPVVSSLLAIVHIGLGLFVSDTPAWLAAKGRHSEAQAVSVSLYGPKDAETSGIGASGRNSPNHLGEADSDARTALLEEPQSPDVPLRGTSSLVPPTESIGLASLLSKVELRRPLLIVSAAMLAQQGSGINAVIYYSTDILQQALSTDAAFISILIGIVNVVMTFAPILLINKYGTRKLLLASIVGAFVSSALLGYGLDSGTIWLSGVTIVLFVAAFALGLGPVPFMLTAELVPYYATSSLSSFALCLNWSANFVVGIGFLPLRNLLASIGKSQSPDEDEEGGQGRVFYVFAGLMVVIGVAILRLYRRR